MSNSIPHLVKNGIPSLNGITESFIKGQAGVADYIYAVRDVFLEAACMFVGDTFTLMNTMLRDSAMRIEHWEIVRTDVKKIRILFHGKRFGCSGLDLFGQCILSVPCEIYLVSCFGRHGRLYRLLVATSCLRNRIPLCRRDRFFLLHRQHSEPFSLS